MSKIALVGPKFMVAPLSATGVEVFPCDSTRQSREALLELSKKKEHAVVFMIERYSLELKEEIEAAEEKGLNILLLPDHRGSIGFYREMLKGLLKKVAGTVPL